MKTALLAGLLFALPLCAQNPPAQENPPAQDPSAQPKLEAPQMAAPEQQEEKKSAPKPAPKAAAPAKKAVPSGESRVVEEIIARVNNEIITSSELEKAKTSAAEEAQQDCNGRCTHEQLQVAIDDRQNTALRDLIDQSLLAQRG